MSLGLIRRTKAVITVTVNGKPRRFTLRAESIAEHLELVELQRESRLEAFSAAALAAQDLLSADALAWADLAADLVVATHLLSEPVDGGQPLTEEESWSLDLADPARVLALQRKLTDVERVLQATSLDGNITLEDLAGSWLDVASTIAQARLAPDAQMPLTSWSVEQCLEVYYRALSVIWRENALKISLAGGKPGKEPSFRPEAPGKPTTRAGSTEEHFQQMKATVENRPGNCDPDGRKFPGML